MSVMKPVPTSDIICIVISSINVTLGMMGKKGYEKCFCAKSHKIKFTVIS